MKCPYCNHALTPEDARSIRGALHASERKQHRGGKPASCACGTCRKCKQREYKRKARTQEKAK